MDVRLLVVVVMLFTSASSMGYGSRSLTLLESASLADVIVLGRVSEDVGRSGKHRNLAYAQLYIDEVLLGTEKQGDVLVLPRRILRSRLDNRVIVLIGRSYRQHMLQRLYNPHIRDLLRDFLALSASEKGCAQRVLELLMNHATQCSARRSVFRELAHGRRKLSNLHQREWLLGLFLSGSPNAPDMFDFGIDLLAVLNLHHPRIPQFLLPALVEMRRELEEDPTIFYANRQKLLDQAMPFTVFTTVAKLRAALPPAGIIYVAIEHGEKVEAPVSFDQFCLLDDLIEEMEVLSAFAQHTHL